MVLEGVEVSAIWPKCCVVMEFERSTGFSIVSGRLELRPALGPATQWVKGKVQVSINVVCGCEINHETVFLL